MKQAFIFPLFIPNSNTTEYYRMMYYAMETLCRTSDNNRNFDIIIYYYAHGYDIKNYKHFEGNENLFNDFPFIKFVEFPFDMTKSSDVYFFKWKCIDHLFKNFEYDKVFITDADLIFYGNPSYVFDKYSEDYAHVLFEGSDKVVKEVLGRDGIAGGQLVLSKKLYDSKIKNIYHKISEERNILINKAKSILNNQDFLYFDKLSDQYSLMNCLLKSGVELMPIDGKDILYGILACNIEIKNEQIEIRSNTNILHYLGPYAYLFLPDRLKNEQMRQKYREKIKQKPLIYY